MKETYAGSGRTFWGHDGCQSFWKRKDTTTPGDNIAKEEISVIFDAQAMLIKGKEDLLQ